MGPHEGSRVTCPGPGQLQGHRGWCGREPETLGHIRRPPQGRQDHEL